jgi:hypothetical protein
VKPSEAVVQFFVDAEIFQEVWCVPPTLNSRRGVFTQSRLVFACKAKLATGRFLDG